MNNKGTVVFLATFLFVAIIVGKIAWLVGTVVAYALLTAIIKYLGKRLLATRSNKSVKLGPLGFHLQPAQTSVHDLLRQVESRLGSTKDSIQDINTRFLLVTGLWDIAEPVPEFLRQSIFRKICFEQLRLIGNPTATPTNSGSVLTPALVFRRLDEAEKVDFMHYCLTNA